MNVDWELACHWWRYTSSRCAPKVGVSCHNGMGKVDKEIRVSELLQIYDVCLYLHVQSSQVLRYKVYYYLINFTVVSFDN